MVMPIVETLTNASLPCTLDNWSMEVYFAY